MIEVAKNLWIENRDVSIAFFEDILDIILLSIAFEFLFWPNIRFRAQMMIIIKAVDELLSVNVLLISGTAVPQMRVGVDNKYFFSGLCSKHGGSSVVLC